MKIIQHSKINIVLTYSRIFSFTSDRFTSGFAFECDERGNVLSSITSEVGSNYRQCLTGFIDEHKIYDLGIKKYEHTYKVPAIGECVCGATLELSGFTNTCECGRDYNWGGQELAPRECWGEETGESAEDILAIK